MYHSIIHSDYMPVYFYNNGNLHCPIRPPELDHHLRHLLKLKIPICLHYTTFRIAKRYASILAFRHPFLAGRPRVALRFLIHETQEQVCHEILFRELAESFPELVSLPSLLITDRELSFKAERARFFSLMAHMFCYLHIYRVRVKFLTPHMITLELPCLTLHFCFQNIDDWCSRNAQSARAEEYKRDVRLLLFSSSEAKFDSRLKKLLQKWTPQFRACFTRCLYDDVCASARFEADNWGVFEPGSGVCDLVSFVIFIRSSGVNLHKLCL